MNHDTHKTYALFLTLALLVFPLNTAGHPENESKSYYERNLFVNAVPISEAVIDRTTHFVYFKLMESYEYNGRCASRNMDDKVRYVAYPMEKLHPVLVIDRNILVTSLSFTLLGRCSGDLGDPTEDLETTKTPGGQTAYIAENVVIHFPSTANRTQWAGKIDAEMMLSRTNKLSELKKKGGGEIPLQAK